MTDTVELLASSRLRRSRPEIAESLGGPPFKRHIRLALRVYGAMLAALLFLYFLRPPGAGIFLMIVLCLWMILTPWAIGRSIAARVNGSRFFVPACDAVEAGKLNCSYVVRGTLCTGGIAVVDEAHRRLWLNGHLLRFEDISTVEWETVGRRHRLSITVKSGAQPITTLSFDAEDQMRQAYARLSNTLGLK